jgi:two-component system NarL family response regulator
MIHILMISSFPIFSQGIEALLGAETGLEIVGRETDLERAMERINELAPDVVILDSAVPEWNDMAVVLRILNARWGTRVIALNLQDNSINVYREERRVAKGITDLVEAIKASPVTAN